MTNGFEVEKEANASDHNKIINLVAEKCRFDRRHHHHHHRQHTLNQRAKDPLFGQLIESRIIKDSSAAFNRHIVHGMS